MTQHPLRCETCNHYRPYTDTDSCKDMWCESCGVSITFTKTFIELVGCASHSDVEKRDPSVDCFYTCEHGKRLQDEARADERGKVLDSILKRIDEMQPAITTNAPEFNDGRDCAYNFVRRLIEDERLRPLR